MTAGGRHEYLEWVLMVLLLGFDYVFLSCFPFFFALESEEFIGSMQSFLFPSFYLHFLFLLRKYGLFVRMHADWMGKGRAWGEWNVIEVGWSGVGIPFLRCRDGLWSGSLFVSFVSLDLGYQRYRYDYYEL